MTETSTHAGVVVIGIPVLQMSVHREETVETTQRTTKRDSERREEDEVKVRRPARADLRRGAMTERTADMARGS